MTTHTNPEWVIANGRIRHVGEFEGLPVGERPLAHCTECREPVTLKLGAVRAAHYAHRPDSTCSLTSGESALHLNTKWALARRLKALARLDIERPCIGCGRAVAFTWLDGWDRVAVERAVPGSPCRPDISLWKGGEVIAAVEIVVSHALEQGTRALYKARGIRFVEVAGGVERLWRGERPMPWRSVHPAPPAYSCPACQQAAAANAARRAQLPAVVEASAALPEGAEARPYSWIVVDCYRPDGLLDRRAYRLDCVWQQGQRIAARLLYIGAEGAALIRESRAATPEQVNASLHAALGWELQEQAKASAIVRQRGWQSYRGDASDEDPARFPLEYMWAGHKHGWVPTLAHGDAA